MTSLFRPGAHVSVADIVPAHSGSRGFNILSIPNVPIPNRIFELVLGYQSPASGRDQSPIPVHPDTGTAWVEPPPARRRTRTPICLIESSGSARALEILLTIPRDED